MQMKTNRYGELLLMVSGSWLIRYFELIFCESVELEHKTGLNDSFAKCSTNRIGNVFTKELYQFYHTHEILLV